MIQVFENAEALSHAAAELFVAGARQGLVRDCFSVALSGGESPRRMYELLSRPPYIDQVPWDIVQVYWGDERCVPPHHPLSNERLARAAFLDHVPIPDEQIHPIACGQGAPQAAQRYEAELRRFFAGEPETFDLVLLGLGEDGHIASLFKDRFEPHRQDWVFSVHLPVEEYARVTLSPALINQSRLVVFLVMGWEKAPILKRIFESEEMLPARWIQPQRGQVLWLLDWAAASQLSIEPEKFAIETLTLKQQWTSR